MATVHISFKQLDIHLSSESIHFHDSCHSFESFKRMHCPLSHCVFVWCSHAVESFVVPPDVQGEVEEVTSAVKIVFMLVLLSQSYGYYIHIIPELCFKFCVINVGLIMALLRWDYSHWHQLIIQEIVLETIFSTLRSVCLNDRFSHSRHRFTSLTFDQ